MNRTAPAVLLDVDGTLVDSNYLHVYAWQRAFADARIPVPTWRIHRHIGMDGSTLVAELTPEADDDLRQQIKDHHKRNYRDTVPLLHLLPGARALLRRIGQLGLQVVLASSAPEDELAINRRLLDCDDVITHTTSSRDVDVAKPDPGIVRVALDQAGVPADRAVFVGDAMWDAQAARRAGLDCIALRSGGTADCELENAGAVQVFDDPADLLANLDHTVIAELSQLR